ncbi:MAG: alkaline phosphatase D family protein [Rhodospirillaceae bacterium]|nr:alkaline phosphatase D family protein [Rhodospirillaceae bacterium]
MTTSTDDQSPPHGLMLDRRGLMAAATAAAAGMPATAAATATVRFTHNVASGDPLHTAVVIWTRAEPATSSERVDVVWDVSETETFETVAHSGTASTDASRDYTVKVDVTGLKPGRTYYYRFKAGDVVSPTGRTRTFPQTGNRPLKLAVFCCANVGQGFFNVYRHCADRDDIDVALHIGDYIYEYGPAIYTDEEIARGSRIAEPRKKLVTLDDYRKRYGSYRLDPDLQDVHRRHPFITVWDDHEIANNAHKNGSENHWSGSEGTWEERKARAIQAYFEWMPIRPLTPDPTGRIFRSFDFGDVASIIMLDTRLYGRDPAPGGSQMVFLTQPSPDGTAAWPMPYDARAWPPAPRPDLFETVGGDAKKLPAGHIFMPDFARYIAEVLNAERTILGAEQEAWLSDTLKASKARGAPWQILGQQTIAATFFPVDPSAHMDPVRGGRFTNDFFMRMRLQDQNNLPFASDTWGGGYPRSRDRMIESLRAHANNTIILSGDLHNAWGFVHRDKQGDMRAFEVTTASVSSPGMESFMGVNGPSMAQAMIAKNKNMVYGELSSRGYAVVELTPETANVDWVFVDTVRSKTFNAKVDKRLSIAARTPGRDMHVITRQDATLADPAHVNPGK